MKIQSDVHVIISDIENDPEGLEWLEIRIGGQIDTTTEDADLTERSIMARYAENRWEWYYIEDEWDDMDKEVVRIVETYLNGISNFSTKESDLL